MPSISCKIAFHNHSTKKSKIQGPGKPLNTPLTFREAILKAEC